MRMEIKGNGDWQMARAGGGHPRYKPRSGVTKQRHEPEVHVQLLMAVKECQTRIVRNEVDAELLKPSEHHDILDDTGGGLPGNMR